MKLKKYISLALSVAMLMLYFPMTKINVNASTYDYLFPVNNGGNIAYVYGYSESYGGYHYGIDIHSSGDDNIYAAYGGTVSAVANSCPHVSCGYACDEYEDFGNSIKVAQDDGTTAYYGHLLKDSLNVSVGDRITKGQAIATMGSSGYSTGKHLHFEVRSGSTKINVNPASAGGEINYTYSGYGSASQSASVPEPIDYPVADGNYMIKSASNTSYYMNVYAGKDANGTKVVTWTIDTETDDQHFNFVHQGNGAYFIYAVGLTNRVLDLYYGSDSAISIGDYLQVWTQGADDNSSIFNVVPVGDNKYVFELKYMDNAVLTMTSASNNATITLQQYIGSDAQHWYICNYSGTILGTCTLRGCSYSGIVTAPTCTEQGYTTYICDVCGASYVADYTDAAGHSYEAVVTDPTEDAQGYTTHTCTVCGDCYIDSYTDPIPSNIPEGLEYEISDGEVTITGYTGSVAELIIPDTIEGYPVTKIGSSAFYNCTCLTGVTVPESVTSIGYYTFNNCTNLIGIWVDEDNVNYSNDDYGVLFNKDKTELIRAPETLAGDYSIPNDVASIDFAAFYGCTSLTGVTIPDSVTSIGASAFHFCIDLTNITIPESVTSIGNGAFSHCSDLTSITIPEKVTRIHDYAFYYCGNLTGVIIPDNVTCIGEFAFSNCTSLTKITISDSITSIDERAFENCADLSEITFTGDVPSFGSNVFYEVSATAYYPADNDTWSENVMQDYGGTISWVAQKITSESSVVQWNLVLEDNLCVNFYLSLSGTEQVQITVGDSTVTYSAAELEITEDGYYKVSSCLAAAQMTDDITVQVTDMEPAVYTVRQYCDAVLADESNSQYHQLIKEMLNYGAMAQIYFAHNTESLASEGITGVAAEEVPESADTEMCVTGYVDGLSFYGASLVFTDKIVMRYYYVTDEIIFDYTFGTVLGPLSGILYDPVMKDNMYYVQVGGMLPQDLDEQIEVYVSDENGNVLTVSYSPMNYIVRMSQKGSANAKALVKALYNYHLAAKALCK